MTANRSSYPLVSRQVTRDIGIYQDYHGNWRANTEIKRAHADGMVAWCQYQGAGDTPEAALSTLRKAIREGEEGWSW